jgi:hypothetical protein
MPIKLLTALFALLLLTGAAFGQQLRRTTPPTAEYKAGERSVSYERGVPLATVKLYAKYMLAHYAGDDYYTNYDLYRMPNSTDMYFGTAYDGSKMILLLLTIKGGQVSEASRIDSEGCGLVQPFFFAGPGRVLLILSNSAPDGGFCGNWIYEFKGDNWTPAGEIDVYDAVHGDGAFQGHSPIESGATARFANGKYYVTMRGRGALRSLSQDDDRVLARHGVPLTFFYDGVRWRK